MKRSSSTNKKAHYSSGDGGDELDQHQRILRAPQHQYQQQQGQQDELDRRVAHSGNRAGIGASRSYGNISALSQNESTNPTTVVVPIVPNQQHLQQQRGDVALPPPVSAGMQTSFVLPTRNTNIILNHQRSLSDTYNTHAQYYDDTRSNRGPRQAVYLPTDDPPAILPYSRSNNPKLTSSSSVSSFNQSLSALEVSIPSSSNHHRNPSIADSISLSSASPSTPPRKLWERHYGSFLKQKGLSKGQQQQPTQQQQVTASRHRTVSAANDNSNHSQHSDGGNGVAAAAGIVFPSSPSVPQRSLLGSNRRASSGSGNNFLGKFGNHEQRGSSSGVTNNNLTAADGERFSGSPGSSVATAVATTLSSTTTNETSIRGGKLFGSMFGSSGGAKKDRQQQQFQTNVSNHSSSSNRTHTSAPVVSSSSGTNYHPHSPRSRAAIILPSIRRRTKSTNELDGTLKRGTDKQSYYTSSPKGSSPSVIISSPNAQKQLQQQPNEAQQQQQSTSPSALSDLSSTPPSTSLLSASLAAATATGNTGAPAGHSSIGHMHNSSLSSVDSIHLLAPGTAAAAAVMGRPMPPSSNTMQSQIQQIQIPSYHPRYNNHQQCVTEASEENIVNQIFPSHGDEYGRKARSAPMVADSSIDGGNAVFGRDNLNQRRAPEPPFSLAVPPSLPTMIIKANPLVTATKTLADTTATTTPSKTQDLTTATTATSSDIKKAFTEFHNAAADSFSAYLGDEPSSKGGKNMYWAQRNFLHPRYHVPSATTISQHPHAPSPEQPTPKEGRLRSSSENLPAIVSEPNSEEFAIIEDGSAVHLNVTQQTMKTSSSHDSFARVMFPTDNFGQQIHASSVITSKPLVSETLFNNSGFPSLPMKLMSAPFSNRLDTVHENVTIHRTMRMLRPIQGVEVWQTGRRYLIAPAALAACPPAVISAFWGVTSIDSTASNLEDTIGSGIDIEKPPSLAFQSAAQAAQPSASYFGSILLGECLLSYRQTSSASLDVSGGASTVQQWSSATLVLRQNYLLEFDPDHNFSRSCIPRGYIHLEHSKCYAHSVFADALELHFYASPCAKADKRILLIRIKSSKTAFDDLADQDHSHHDDNNDEYNTSPYGSGDSTEPIALAKNNIARQQILQQREQWKICFNRAASLSIDSLYEFPTKPSNYADEDDNNIPNTGGEIDVSVLKGKKGDDPSVLGRGQYVTVRAARRRHRTLFKSTSSTSLADAANEGNVLGDGIPDSEKFDCALKIFEKNDFWKMVVKGRERADTLVREASVQATLTVKAGTNVDSFLRIRGFFETVDKVVLELERLDGTDLYKYISSKGTLSEVEAARIMRDILQSLRAMNRLGLAHRDIKPANVLMCHTNITTGKADNVAQFDRANSSVAVKLADFGMATFVGVDGHVRGRCGTPGYVAPEIFTAGIHGGYGNKVDVFSAGVTLYVMLCGYEPFYGETDAELVAANKNAGQVEFPADDWAHVSTEARDLVRQMMDPNPTKRCSVKEALQHPWFSETLYSQDPRISESLRSSEGSAAVPSNLISSLQSYADDGSFVVPDGDGACIIS